MTAQVGRQPAKLRQPPLGEIAVTGAVAGHAMEREHRRSMPRSESMQVQHGYGSCSPSSPIQAIVAPTR